MMGILKIQNEGAYYSLKIDAFVIFESTSYACAYFIWTWGNAILHHPQAVLSFTTYHSLDAAGLLHIVQGKSDVPIMVESQKKPIYFNR